jgi:hypothetical protein
MDDNGLLGLFFGGMFGMMWLLVLLVVIVGMWKVFEKAGHPGWAAIVPIYNLIVLLQIAGKPLWWIVLLFIPVANFIAAILISIAVAEKFGKGVGYGLGLAFLGVIFYPMLGFGSARYQGGATAAPSALPT